MIPIDTHLTALIAHGDDIAVTEPVITEVLAGARDDHRERGLRRLMQRFVLLPFDSAVDLDAAARIYRRVAVWV